MKLNHIVLFFSLVVGIIVISGNSGFGGNFDPCESAKTSKQQEQCERFHKKASKYRKKLDRAVDKIGDTIRKPIKVPDGVRRMPQQQQYIK